MTLCADANVHTTAVQYHVQCIQCIGVHYSYCHQKHFFQFKMHQISFGGRALPGAIGELKALSAPPDSQSVAGEGMRNKEGRRKSDGRRRRKGRKEGDEKLRFSKVSVNTSFEAKDKDMVNWRRGSSRSRPSPR